MQLYTFIMFCLFTPEPYVNARDTWGRRPGFRRVPGEKHPRLGMLGLGLKWFCFRLSAQCSQSCGGGTQKQGAACKQRLADGSVLELPDTFCPVRGPTALRPCNATDCPPWWAPANWSQVWLRCLETSLLTAPYSVPPPPGLIPLPLCF